MKPALLSICTFLLATVALTACKQTGTTNHPSDSTGVAAHPADFKMDAAKEKWLAKFATYEMDSDNPPDATPEPTESNAKTPITTYIGSAGPKLCISYSIDKAYMDNLKNDEPFVHAIRIYNGFTNPNAPNDARMIVHPLYRGGNTVSLIPGAKVYYGRSPGNLSSPTAADQLNNAIGVTALTLDPVLASRTWYKNYYRQSANYPGGTYDKFNSCLILISDYNKVISAVPGGTNYSGIRIFHGLQGASDRILVLVALNNAGAPIWSTAHITSANTNLCPEECDFF